MDKGKLIAQAAKKSGYAKWEVNKSTDSLLESILDALQRGEDVNLSDFGRFELKVRKARNVIHPRTKLPVHIPEKINVVFTVSRKFKAEEGVIEKIRSQGEAAK